ncbi:nucleolar complex protein 2 homolog, partial [Tachysurus ichikawai]
MAGKIKRKLEDLSVDEFLLSGFDTCEANESEDDVSSMENGTNNSVPRDKSLTKKGKASQHKDQLARLKDQDPEFFKFLKDNDHNLLNFDDADSSGDEEEKYHTLPSQLEVASSDEEVDENDEKKEKSAKKTTKVTIKMVENWKKALK